MSRQDGETSRVGDAVEPRRRVGGCCDEFRSGGVEADVEDFVDVPSESLDTFPGCDVPDLARTVDGRCGT